MLGITTFEARIVIRFVIWSKSEMSRLFLLSTYKKASILFFPSFVQAVNSYFLVKQGLTIFCLEASNCFPCRVPPLKRNPLFDLQISPRLLAAGPTDLSGFNSSIFLHSAHIYLLYFSFLFFFIDRDLSSIEQPT